MSYPSSQKSEIHGHSQNIRQMVKLAVLMNRIKKLDNYEAEKAVRDAFYEEIRSMIRSYDECKRFDNGDYTFEQMQEVVKDELRREFKILADKLVKFGLEGLPTWEIEFLGQRRGVPLRPITIFSGKDSNSEQQLVEKKSEVRRTKDEGKSPCFVLDELEVLYHQKLDRLKREKSEMEANARVFDNNDWAVGEIQGVSPNSGTTIPLKNLLKDYVHYLDAERELTILDRDKLWKELLEADPIVYHRFLIHYHPDLNINMIKYR